MIPVHLDCLPTQVRAECVRCGKCASAAASSDPEDGGPKTRQNDAKRRALKALVELCEERLPLGPEPRTLRPHHHERVIPRGLSLYVEDAGDRNRLYELFVNEKGKLETAAGGCDFAAAVLVIPEAKKLEGAAVEFANVLKGRGYLRAQVAAAGRLKRRAKG